MSENTAITENAAVCTPDVCSPLDFASTKLEKEVARIILRECGDYPNWIKWAEDLVSHGCASAMASCLIYYHQTLPFFKRHKAEINALLVEALLNVDVNSVAELLEKDWDDSDPLALEETNQNLLAWFAFEDTVYRLLGSAEAV